MRPPDKGASHRVTEWNGSLRVGHRRGRLAVAMFCNWDGVALGRNSEQLGSDPSLAIGQIAGEIGQLAVDAFHSIVLLSVELTLHVCYQFPGVLGHR